MNTTQIPTLEQFELCLMWLANQHPGLDTNQFGHWSDALRHFSVPGCFYEKHGTEDEPYCLRIWLTEYGRVVLAKQNHSRLPHDTDEYLGLWWEEFIRVGERR